MKKLITLTLIYLITGFASLASAVFDDQIKITRSQLDVMIANNENISNLDTSGIINMSGLFKDNTFFNQDISKWNVSNVFSMAEMFSGATSFNQDLSAWNVGSVVNMSYLFKDAVLFNHDISSWDVSSVFSMNEMFNRSTNFNQDIGSWNVKGVSSMNDMFMNAKNFNQNISSWDVSYVDSMSNMFKGALTFDQNISSWDVSLVSSSIGFRDFSALSCINTPALPRVLTGCMDIEPASLNALITIPIHPSKVVSTPITPQSPQAPVVATNITTIQNAETLPTNPGFFRSSLETTNSALSSVFNVLKNALTSNRSLPDTAKTELVNHTEKAINDYSNEKINAITPGKTKISITGIENSRPIVSIKTIQPLFTPKQGARNLSFIQGSLSNNTGVTNDRTTINVGIGKRYLSRDSQSIAGANVFYDYELDSRHQRASLGAEYKRSNFTANANIYIPISDEKLIDIHREEVLAGHDIRLSGQMPFTPWAKIKYTKYNWKAKNGESSAGNKLGLNVKLSQNTDLEINKNFSDTGEDKMSAQISVSLPLSENEKITTFAFDTRAFRPSQNMDLMDLDLVERENDIKVKQSLNGSTVIIGVFNATTSGASCSLKTEQGIPVKDIYGDAISGTTDASGTVSFSNVVVPLGIVVAECQPGNYTDEATGSSAYSPELHAAKIISGSNLNLELYATPVSEIAYRRANEDSDLSDIDVKTIQTSEVFGMQGVDINTTKPEDLNTTTVSATDEGKYGLVLAAISQLASEGSLTPEQIIADLNTTIKLTGQLPSNKITNAIRRLSESGVGASGNVSTSTDALDNLQASKQPTKEILISSTTMNLTEGVQSEYTISLTTQPIDQVDISISSQSGAISANPSVLSLTPSNWWKKNVVYLTAYEDINTTDSTDSLTHTVTTSEYSTIPANSITAIITDDDTPSVAMTISATALFEDATAPDPQTSTISIVLNNQPTTDVTIDLSIDNTRITLDKSTVSFTPDNWVTPQDVEIMASSDSVENAVNTSIITLSINSSSDDDYESIILDPITITLTDDDTANIFVSTISGSTSEDSVSATFTVVLGSEPTDDVTISMYSDNPSEGSVSSEVVFSPTDWDTPITITVTGVDDTVDDGDISYNILLSPITSNDPKYSGFTSSPVSITNIDNDTTGILVSDSSLITSEDSANKPTFTLVLASKPSGYVSIPLSSSDTSEGILDITNVIFDHNNWSIPQTITVTGQPDDIDDDNTAYSIYIGSASSTDNNYAGIDPSDIAMINEDDASDVAQVILSATTLTTNESNQSSDSLTLVLTTEPTAPVTISFSLTDNSEGILDTSTIIFTPTDWTTPKQITVTALNDDVDDGDVSYTLTTVLQSTDLVYDVVDPSDINITNIDDDTKGFTFVPVSGNTTEDGGTATFEIKLNSEPTATVNVNFETQVSGVLDQTEGTIFPTSVSFTASNWNTLQLLTITGVDDNSVDGNQTYQIVSTASSTDTEYHAENIDDISLSNIDDDVIGATVSPTALITTESSGTATFSIKLDSAPIDTVTIPLSSTNTSEGTISQDSVVFTSSDWNTPQVITVTGIDDSIDDDDIAYEVITGPATTSTTANAYNGYDADDVSLTNTDDDTATVFVNTSTVNNITAIDDTTTFTVELTSEPLFDVSFSITSDNSNQGIASPSTIAFTTSDWNVPQTITVTGAATGTYNPSTAYLILTGMTSSGDSKYSSIDPPDPTITNFDGL